MRKQTKLVAVLSAAALMAMGASMTAFADWSQEDGEWVYLDRNGDRFPKRGQAATASGIILARAAP